MSESQEKTIRKKYGLFSLNDHLNLEINSLKECAIKMDTCIKNAMNFIHIPILKIQTEKNVKIVV
ncbi:hypothetical protein LEP1GSC158_3403 [Leptospira interrogans serovar Zanoni str. LT2156]|uniref:Uncharacterized protein n=1 Tax=Leptospira interrogans serovar Zanoni str. LT2156 TaxID=1001601 RepID=M6HKP2_LEPIR|nr:hypothetical protein LEP1GSC158_3403 [Leptospira interrogans serovar Zanoni str. LT2156]